MNPIALDVAATLDPTTWDWSKVVFPLAISLLTVFGRYLFLSTPSRSSRRITHLLELKAKVPEADHIYLEPAYRLALRRYLQRSLNAEMPFLHKFGLAISWLILLYFYGLLLWAALLVIAKIGAPQVFLMLLLASFFLLAFALLKDLLNAERIQHMVRMRSYWDKAGWYYRNRPKVGQDRGAFKPKYFFALLVVVAFLTGSITWSANSHNLKGALIFAAAALLVAASWYFTGLRMFFLAFKPGSRRHLLIPIQRSFITLGLAVLPSALLYGAAFLAR